MLKSAVLAAVATAATLGAANAEAGVSWSIGINLPPLAAVIGAPVYRTSPVAYVPVPAYGAPVYAVSAEAPVYLAPRRYGRFVSVPAYGPGYRAVPRAVVYPYRPRDQGGWQAPVVAVPPAYAVSPGYAPVPSRRW